MAGADTPPISLTQAGTTVVFAVRVIPRAGRTAVAGLRGDALLVRLSAPPVEGAANDALTAFVASLFSRPKRDVAIVSGHASRDKRIAIGAATVEQVGARLSAILAEL